MKRVNRAQLRGQPLDEMCKMARTSTHEYGLEDKQVFCYGWRNAMTDELEYECSKCGAHVNNVTPLLKEKTENDL